jgi:hypothetical protein
MPRSAKHSPNARVAFRGLLRGVEGRVAEERRRGGQVDPRRANVIPRPGEARARVRDADRVRRNRGASFRHGPPWPAATVQVQAFREGAVGSDEDVPAVGSPHSAS